MKKVLLISALATVAMGTSAELLVDCQFNEAGSSINVSSFVNAGTSGTSFTGNKGAVIENGAVTIAVDSWFNSNVDLGAITAGRVQLELRLSDWSLSSASTAPLKLRMATSGGGDVYSAATATDQKLTSHLGTS